MIQCKPRKGNFDKRNLWPWRDWMTIGIGVLATSEKGRKENRLPDHIVLIADTMGSFGDVDSHPRLHKMFAYPENDLYIAAADQVDKAAELFPIINGAIGAVPKAERIYGRILHTVAEACFFYKHEKFTMGVLPRFGLPPLPFDPRTVPQELSARIGEEWNNFGIGCDLILGTFNNLGNAFLLHISGDGYIENVSYPGIWAIGTGSENALFWLSRRKQTMGDNVAKSAYHAYEAKRMAEGSPHVNEHLDMFIARQGEHWFTTSHPKSTNIKEHPGITITRLERMFQRYGPRSTDSIKK